MAIGVVLYHRAAQRQLGGGSRIPIWSPDAAYLLAREGPDLGIFGRDHGAPNLPPEYDNPEDQARRCDPGHAYTPDPSMSAPDLLFVGVRFGRVPYAAKAFWHDARRYLEGALQGQRDTATLDQSSRAQL